MTLQSVLATNNIPVYVDELVSCDSYFQPSVQALDERLGNMGPIQKDGLYTRLIQAYQYIFGDQWGEAYCYEPDFGGVLRSQKYNKICPDYPETSFLKNSETDVMAGFCIPSSLAHRAFMREPCVTNNDFRVLNGYVKNALFYAMSMNGSDLEWHYHKSNTLDNVDLRKAIASLRVFGRDFEPNRFDTSLLAQRDEKWLDLSLSGQFAFETRNYGLMQLYSRKVKLQSTVYRHTERWLSDLMFRNLYEHGHTGCTRAFNKILFFIPQHKLNALYESAYHVGLLPLFPNPAVSLTWSRRPTGFDVMFELLLKGNLDELIATDKLALKSKGIVC